MELLDYLTLIVQAAITNSIITEPCLLFQLSFTPPECSRLRYICIRTAPGEGATYMDSNTENDVMCADWTEFLLCQPRE